jgi:poly(3-hydroxybutyrate) depolymerase
MNMHAACVIGAAILDVGISSSAQAQNSAAARSSCNLPHAAGVVQERLVSGQRQRAYRLFVPTAYGSRSRLPLVLDLHGSGGTSADQARTSRFEILAALTRLRVATLKPTAPAGVRSRTGGPTTSPT